MDELLLVRYCNSSVNSPGIEREGRRVSEIWRKGQNENREFGMQEEKESNFRNK